MKYPFYFVSILILVFYTPNIAVGGGSYLAGYTPEFEETPCPFDADDEILEQVRCGFLIVPENRSVSDGRQLRLAVAILKSTNPYPQPDPLVYLTGGPGQGFVRNTPGILRNEFWNRLREDRDIILYDRRGTGYSEPQICPDLNREQTMITYQSLTVDEKNRQMQEAMNRCSEYMMHEGIDPSQYNTIVSSYDLDDLRRALGYETWNLWGISYGTRLGLVAMRTVPDGIRSVMLDSPLPPNAAGWADAPVNVSEVAKRFFAVCAADPSCNETFPRIKQRIYDIAEELNNNPIIVEIDGSENLPETVIIRGDTFLEGVFGFLNNSPSHPVIPVIIEEIEKRNKALIKGLVQLLHITPDILSWGTFWVIECFDLAPFNGPEVREARIGLYNPRITEIGFDGPDVEICEGLHPYRADAGFSDPVISDIPALIFSGEFDVVTTLRNGQHIMLPGGGHGVTRLNECPQEMMIDFLQSPGMRVDEACLADIPPVSFMTDVKVLPGLGRISMMLGNGSFPGSFYVFFVSVIILLSAIVLWPAGAAIKKIRHTERRPLTSLEKTARWSVTVPAVFALGFAAGLVWVASGIIADNPILLLIGVPGSLAPLFVIPWLLLIGCVAALVFTVLIWKRSSWGLTGKIHYTLVALSCVVFTFLVFMWGRV